MPSGKAEGRCEANNARRGCGFGRFLSAATYSCSAKPVLDILILFVYIVIKNK